MAINSPKFDLPIFVLTYVLSCASIKMSILQYLKPSLKILAELLKDLPDPNGTLSNTVPPSAIKMANDEVSKVMPAFSNSK